MKCPVCKEGELKLVKYEVKKVSYFPVNKKGVLRCNKCGHNDSLSFLI